MSIAKRLHAKYGRDHKVKGDDRIVLNYLKQIGPNPPPPDETPAKKPRKRRAKEQKEG